MQQAALTAESAALLEDGHRIDVLGEEIEQKRRDLLRAVLVNDALATDRYSRKSMLAVIELDSLSRTHDTAIQAHISWKRNYELRNLAIKADTP